MLQKAAKSCKNHVANTKYWSQLQNILSFSRPLQDLQYMDLRFDPDPSNDVTALGEEGQGFSDDK